MAYWIEEKTLRQARALASSDWESPKSLMQMRHMAKDGATQEEIAAALGWFDICESTGARRLKKYNIVAGRNKHGNRIRKGGDVYLKDNGKGLDMRSYRALAKTQKTGV